MSLDWVAVENAIATWVRTASGQATVWSDQGGPLPAYPFCTLRWTGMMDRGVDEILQLQDLNRPAGQEIELRARSSIDLQLSVQAFADTDRALGANSPIAVLSKVRTRSWLPTVRKGLLAVGVAPYQLGPLQNLAELFETGFRPRAQFDAFFHAIATESEFLGYFATLKVQGTFKPDPPKVKNFTFQVG